MMRRIFIIFILLASLSLLVGCNIQKAIGTQDHYQMWINFFDFQKEFDKLPEGITFSPWQTQPKSNGDMIHRTVLSHNNDRCRHTLEVTTNNNWYILNIALQGLQTDINDPCFAEISYHVFCSMGFMDGSTKGHTPFVDTNAFYNYFEFFSHENINNSMWINRHEVNYTYLPESETRCFTIHYNHSNE